MALGELQFAAFLSYSRQDKRLAQWLVRALEDFRPPHQTVLELKARQSPFQAARPIFRDEQDMPVGGAIPDRLAEVLDKSAAMIVLCTPASVQSSWVNEEIRRFAERHPTRRIIAGVVDGDPDTDACYPAALRALGKPLAADLRVASERHQALVKIAAAILALDVDQLVNRVRKHRAERMRWIVSGAGIAAAAFIGLGLTTGLMTLRARQADDRARSGVEVLLTDAREEVKAAGQLDAQAAVIAAAEAYFHGKRPSEMTDEDLLLQAKLLVQKGEDAAERGESDSALEFREAAFAVTQELLSRRRDDPERLFAHGQSAFWVGDLHWRRSELEQARYYFEVYRTASGRVVDVKPDYPGAVLEVAYANVNLGQLAVEQFRDPRRAAASFSEAARVVESRAKDVEAKRNLSLILGYQAQAMAQFEPASKVLTLIDAWDKVISELDTARKTDRSLNYDVARDLNFVGEFKLRAGLNKDGEERLARSQRIAREELKSDPKNGLWLSLASRLELKARVDDCPDANEAGAFDFANTIAARRALSCIEHGNTPGMTICREFVAWLATQKATFKVEYMWASILGRCSRDESVIANRSLLEAHDRAAETIFFSRNPHGYSFWTQMELAGFKSAGRNTAKVRELVDDLKGRGWNANDH